jgi:NAD(P)-dependent dehydrogenase (short-subunit alcohol dehydrogenase family)
MSAAPPRSGCWAVLTGANPGIGYALAQILAETGVNAVLACRSNERGQAAGASLQSLLHSTRSLAAPR